jgi:hypothetical protein
MAVTLRRRLRWLVNNGPISFSDRATVDPAHPPLLGRFALILGILVAAWWIADWLVDLDSLPGFGRACRDLGYLALLAMFVPYLYVWRRLYLFRSFGNMTALIRWHIAAAYLAVALTLIHGRGRLFGGSLTTWVVITFGAVFLSGVIGHFSQKVIYRIMPLVVRREHGRADLAGRRAELIKESGERVENYSLLIPDDIRNWRGFCSRMLEDGSLLNRKMFNHKKTFSRGARDLFNAIREKDPDPDQLRMALDVLNRQLQRTDLFQKGDEGTTVVCQELRALLDRKPPKFSQREIERRNRLILEAAYPDLVKVSQPPLPTVTRFFKEEVLGYLSRPLPSWRWLFTQAAIEPVPRNHYLRVRALAPKEQAGVIDQLWAWVEERRQIDLEYWFHRLARLWLWVHGPVSAALLALALAHVYLSIYYTGWL